MVTSSAGQPLAYFITWRTYGTWLHGDERGSVQRGSSGPLAPPISPNPPTSASIGRMLHADYSESMAPVC